MLGKEKKFNSPNPFEKSKKKLIAFVAILSTFFIFTPSQSNASQSSIELPPNSPNTEQALNPYAESSEVNKNFPDEGKTEIEVDPNVQMIDGNLVPIEPLKPTEIQQPVQTQPQVVAHNYPTIFTPKQLQEIKNSASTSKINPNPEAFTVPVFQF
jgi:hypothetical protein